MAKITVRNYNFIDTKALFGNVTVLGGEAKARWKDGVVVEGGFGGVSIRILSTAQQGELELDIPFYTFAGDELVSQEKQNQLVAKINQLKFGTPIELVGVEVTNLSIVNNATVRNQRDDNGNFTETFNKKPVPVLDIEIKDFNIVKQ